MFGDHEDVSSAEPNNATESGRHAADEKD